MSFILRQSAIDPALFEIVEADAVVKEIPIPFRIYKWPSRFASIIAIEQWVEGEEKKRAERAAYRLLNAKNQSSAELKKKLGCRGFSRSVTEEIVEKMKRLGFISDAHLASSLIEREVRRGHGPLYIEMKLRSMGLESSQVRQVVTDDMQREAIRTLIRKRRLSAAALQRRGFDPSLIFSELKKG